MKRLRELNQYRSKAWEKRIAGYQGDDLGGCFRIEGPRGHFLNVMAASGEGWDHVSVSLDLPRCPTWDEMEFVKRLFFKPEECAFQLHVDESKHISVHHHCLHIWRPHDAEIPTPPAWMVA